MPCHRAASPRSLALRSVALTGATLSASLLSPLVSSAPAVAVTAPTGRTATTTTGSAGCTALSTDVSADELESALTDAEPGEVVCVLGAKNSEHAHPRGRERTHRSGGAEQGRPRSETSGERQYQNACGQGYFNDDCEQFSVQDLLSDGIDPLL